VSIGPELNAGGEEQKTTTGGNAKGDGTHFSLGSERGKHRKIYLTTTESESKKYPKKKAQTKRKTFHPAEGDII